MAGLRFICHGGDHGPDLAWLKNMGFDEFGFVVPNVNTIPNATQIHNAGINYATINPFNDGGYGIGTGGDQFAGQFSAMKNAGYNLIAGEGTSGDVIRVAMNYLSYANYGGYGCNGQCNVYTGNYAHPTTGTGGTFHVDYIETYCDGGCGMCTDSTIATMKAAINAGNCAEAGILIGLFPCGSIQSSSYWINVIDKARNANIPCNNVLFWCGYNYDAVGMLKSGAANEVVTGLISHYGVRHGIGSPGNTSTTPTAPVPIPAAVQYGGSTPAICSPGASYISVFVRGTTGNVYLKTHYGGAWHDWTDLGGQAGASTGCGAASWGNNRMDVFVGGAGGAVYHKWYTGTAWSTWVNWGGTTTSDVGACSDSRGNVYAFCRGTDGHCYFKAEINGAQGTWYDIGGALAAGTGPAACSWGSGRLDVAAIGTNNHVYHKAYAGGAWHTWEDLGGAVGATPGIATLGGNQVIIFARGAGGVVYANAWTGSGWGGWSKVGGTLAAGTGVGAVGESGAYHAVAAGPNGNVYHIAGNIGAWTAWADIGGSVSVAPGGETPAAGVPSGGSGAPIAGLPSNAQIRIAFKETNALTYSCPTGKTVTITGHAGYVDGHGNWIPNKPYTGKLWKWTEQYPTKKIVAGAQFSPNGDGSFTWLITDSVAEEMHYNVGFVAGEVKVGQQPGKLISKGVAAHDVITQGSPTTKVTNPSWKTCTIVTEVGCGYCEELIAELNNQGIPYNNVGSVANFNVQRFPGVVLCNGTKIDALAGSTPTSNAAWEISQIKASCYTPGSTTQVPGGRVVTHVPATHDVYGPPTGGYYSPTKWSTHELVVKWGGASSTPTNETPATTPTNETPTTPTPETPVPAPTAQTPLGYQSPDVTLTPVLPIPTAIAAGITVVLRDHKKVGKRSR